MNQFFFKVSGEWEILTQPIKFWNIVLPVNVVKCSVWRLYSERFGKNIITISHGPLQILKVYLPITNFILLLHTFYVSVYELAGRQKMFSQSKDMLHHIHMYLLLANKWHFKFHRNHWFVNHSYHVVFKS